MNYVNLNYASCSAGQLEVGGPQPMNYKNLNLRLNQAPTIDLTQFANYRLENMPMNYKNLNYEIETEETEF